MLRWDMLGYGSSGALHYGVVIYAMLCYGSSVGVGFAWFSSDQLRQLSFVSLWMGGVRCVAVRLGSYG